MTAEGNGAAGAKFFQAFKFIGDTHSGLTPEGADKLRKIRQAVVGQVGGQAAV